MSEDNNQLIVQVNLDARSYEIAIVSNAMPSIGSCVSKWFASIPNRPENADRCLIVTDRNVAPHAVTVAASLEDAGWDCRSITLEPGETSKSYDATHTMYDALVDMKADRHTAIIAVGGGVVGDSAGFIAATYGRGVPFIQVPTTLLAHVDSSVGGKVAINHPKAKNLIGAFYQPQGVFIDTTVLDTLPKRDYRSGLAEVIKYGVILDADFFDYLEQNIDGLNERSPDVMREIIAQSCRLKAHVVENDEFERTGLRAVLNYGHTFAHAFEALCGYGELLHGEAVAIGMVCASRLAERIGLIESAMTARQIELLQAVSLPVELPSDSTLNTDDIIDRMKLDKKTVAGRLRFVLPTKMGHVEVFKDIAESDVRAVLNE